VANRSQLHRVDYEQSLTSEFKPYDFEKRSRSIWSNAEELWRIGVWFLFNEYKSVGKRTLNIIDGKLCVAELIDESPHCFIVIRKDEVNNLTLPSIYDRTLNTLRAAPRRALEGI
jgi:hypothetical protein